MRSTLVIACCSAALVWAPAASAQKMGVAPNTGAVKAQAAKSDPEHATARTHARKHTVKHKHSGHAVAKTGVAAQTSAAASAGEGVTTGRITTRPPAQTTGKLPTSNQEKPAY